MNLTVIDIDPTMAAAAATRLRSFANATVCCADLPFDDDSFDTVVSCLMLHHVLAWEQTLAEVHRVLRRGGRFVGYDLVRNRFTVLLHTLDRSPHRLLTPRELTAGCQQHGFRITVRPRLGGYLMTFAATTES